MRLMYCSGVWAYVVGAMTTPTFIIIPLVTIWIGVFPIVISRKFALAATLYGVATNLLQYTVTKAWYALSEELHARAEPTAWPALSAPGLTALQSQHQQGMHSPGSAWTAQRAVSLC